MTPDVPREPMPHEGTRDRPWGPRPGGVAAPAEPPTYIEPDAYPSGCLGVVFLAIGGLGLLALFQYPTTGILLILIAVAPYAGMHKLNQRDRKRYEQTVARHREAQARWRETRPAARISASNDALSTTRSIARASGGGAFLGITPERQEWLTADPENAVLVLGPPRMGKTRSIAIPSVLSALGPVVSTSTKTEVFNQTAKTRSRLGTVWLFDPSGTEPVPDGVLRLQWSPVASATRWDVARGIADAMVDATGSKPQDDTYVKVETAKALLAPLLHAAALNGLSISDVRRWVSERHLVTADTVLRGASAELALEDLSAIGTMDDQSRSLAFERTRAVLAAYGSQAAADSSRRPNFDPDCFVRSCDTIYITNPSHLQKMTAPLVTGLLEDIRLAGYRLHRWKIDAEAPAPVTWVLDEIANIAPLPTLPGIVSEAGSQGLHIVACFQDLAQARSRWGPDAEGFLSLFGTKVIFPGIGDRTTLDALSTLVGDWDREYTSVSDTYGNTSAPSGNSYSDATTVERTTQREALLTSAEIANIPDGHCLVLQAGIWWLARIVPDYEEPWTTLYRQQPTQYISGESRPREVTGPRHSEQGNTILEPDFQEHGRPL